jgi:uncharacterized protein HemX
MDIKKSDNKSLVIYTSLIFMAAILMIVVSFFAQKHLEDARVSQTEAENITLSNKAASVSEENVQLVELNKTLKSENTNLTQANEQLTAEKEALLAETAAYKGLNQVYKLLLEKKTKAAREKLGSIYTQDLSPEQKEIYDYLVKKTKE